MFRLEVVKTKEILNSKLHRTEFLIGSPKNHIQMVTGSIIGTIDLILVANPKIEVESSQLEVDRSQIKADCLKIASVLPILMPVTIRVRFSALAAALKIGIISATFTSRRTWKTSSPSNSWKSKDEKNRRGYLLYDLLDVEKFLSKLKNSDSKQLKLKKFPTPSHRTPT